MRSPKFIIDPGTRIGHVHLRVADMDKSLGFYQGLLGFKFIGKLPSGACLLSVNGKEPHQIALSEVPWTGRPRERRAGLYHFAILLPERRDLATILQHLMDYQDEVRFEGASDHLVSEALYIRDPEQNGIEIYRDKDRSTWGRLGERVVMSTLPLDSVDLLREVDEDGWRSMPAKATIGHIHLHASNIERSRRFYSDTLGFKLTCSYPGAYFFATNDYHHHIAANAWLGEGILPASQDGPGLDHFALRVPNEHALNAMIERLEERNIRTEELRENGFPKSIFLRDPDNIRIQLYLE